MQPVSDSRIQNPEVPSRQGTSGQYAVKTPLRRAPGMPAEDFVTLSKDRSASLAVKKEPSAPVNASESKALRDSFSTYA